MLRSLAVAALVALLAGCTGDPVEPTAIPTRMATSAAAPASPTPSDDSAGLQACDLLKQAVSQATIMDPGIVGAIAAASSAADAPVADAAGRLSTAYAAATAAKGTVGEPDAVAAVSASAAEMRTLCEDAGLDTVG